MSAPGVRFSLSQVSAANERDRAASRASDETGTPADAAFETAIETPQQQEFS